MRQKTSKPTSAQGFDQAWKRFHEENFGLDEVPPGWINAYDYAKLNGITHGSANCILRRAVETGVASINKFRIVTGNKEVRKVTHFKLKKP
jgi:hypothetical protein